MRNHLLRKETLEEQFGEEDNEFRFGQVQSRRCLQDIQEETLSRQLYLWVEIPGEESGRVNGK